MLRHGEPREDFSIAFRCRRIRHIGDDYELGSTWRGQACLVARRGTSRKRRLTYHHRARNNTAGDTPPSLTSESETKIGRAALPTMISGRGTGGETGNDAGSKASHSFASSHGIDLLRPDGGYASPGLRRRATRSSLIAKSEKRNPTIATPGNLVVHPPTSPPGAPAQFARSAIGVIIPGTSIQNLGVIRQSSGVLVNANAAKTSIGGNAGEIRHENPHPAAMAGASLNSTGLNGAAMGHPTSSPATLGGPAHIASGIGGAIIHSKH